MGLVGFWLGLFMAGRRYPSEYDWRYMSISTLVYTDRNPDGYRWAWGGLMLCALGGLWWTINLFRSARQEGLRASFGIWALGLGYLCMALALVPDRLLPVSKGHEALALAAFLGQCMGIVQLSFRAAPRRFAALPAVGALLPILLALLAPTYVSYAMPELHWVGLDWRARGVPVYLSFPFWEWITCAIFSLYTAALCLGLGLNKA